MGVRTAFAAFFFYKEEQFKINMINEFGNHLKNIYKISVELNKFLALLIVEKKIVFKNLCDTEFSNV